MAPPYLCELINKKESHVNTRLGTDHHQLIMPPISRDCSNTFLERSFMCAAPCEWNKLSEHIRTSNFAVKHKIICGTEQRTKQMETTEEWPATRECSLPNSFQNIHQLSASP